jgi:hypothetical protein
MKTNRIQIIPLAVTTMAAALLLTAFQRNQLGQ